LNYTALEQYWIWLSSIDGIGPKRFYQLLSAFGDARSVWDNTEDAAQILDRRSFASLKKAKSDVYFSRLFEIMDEKGIRAVCRIQDDYPELLGSIYDPPVTLYVRGNVSALNDERCFAIVGSRRCTRDGSRAAREFAGELARNHAVVVSGMAYGIDTAAHTGAVEAHGKTIAVFGCGVDIIYPASNEKLAMQILDEGGALVSEYAPGTQPYPGNFPARNRIISGLCSGMLLVEGARSSGAMHTVEFAQDQGRDVFAVPGSIYSSASEMPNRLIVQGAIPALSGWDILEYYRWAQRPDAAGAKKDELKNLSDDERTIVQALKNQPLSFQEIAQIANLSVNQLNSLLTMMELRGIIVKVPGSQYMSCI